MYQIICSETGEPVAGADTREEAIESANEMSEAYGCGFHYDDNEDEEIISAISNYDD